ncbi:MAG: DUF4857 domain-containing protein [Deferribacteraceae bacterium]|jgi:hypothetical protein|nr:DUF4857 domain-containing protein [Deferribacteraceae bacterium]
MFVNFTRLIIILTASLCLSWALPKLFATIAKKKDETPYITFSAVIKDFLIATHSGKSRYQDTKGNAYTLKEYETLMPFVFTSDLLKWGIYPEEINGVHVPPKKAETDWDSIQVSPSLAHAANTRIQLFPLFESDSEFTSISMPEEFFRIGKRMEFIDASHNKVNEEKSALFTKALSEAGFNFPAQRIAGNPTNHKPYDAGYFVTDASGEMFHIYQARSQPVVVKTDIKAEGGIFFMKVRENQHLPYYGLLVTNPGRVYLILKDRYRLQEVWVENYDPGRQRLNFGVDPLYITVKVLDEEGERSYASERDGIPVKKYFYKYQRRLKYAEAYDTVFTFALNSNPSKRGGFWGITFSKNPSAALSFSLALAIIYTLFLRIQLRIKPKKMIGDFILIALFGIYALIAVILEGFETVGKHKGL